MLLLFLAITVTAASMIPVGFDKVTHNDGVEGILLGGIVMKDVKIRGACERQIPNAFYALYHHLIGGGYVTRITKIECTERMLFHGWMGDPDAKAIIAISTGINSSNEPIISMAHIPSPQDNGILPSKELMDTICNWLVDNAALYCGDKAEIMNITYPAVDIHQEVRIN